MESLEKRVSDLEKNMLFILNSTAHNHQEMIGLKKAVREAIDFIQKGHSDKALQILLYECRWFWMTEYEEKKFVSYFTQ